MATKEELQAQADAEIEALQEQQKALMTQMKVNVDNADILAQTEKLTYLDIHGSGAKIGSIREALDEAVNHNWWIDVSTMLGRADRLTATQKARGKVGLKTAPTWV